VKIIANHNTPRGDLVDGLIGQHAVLRALILRELQTRFGRDNIGYLWVIAEPLMLASVITLLHFVIGETMASGMGPYPFTLLGYCIFIIFRNTFNRSDGLLQSSNNLFYHAQVTPFHIVLAKSVVETIACSSVLVMLMAIGIAVGLSDPPARPVYLGGALLAMATLSFGMTLLATAGTYKSHALSHFIHPFSYFMFPLSGAFLTMAFLPSWARGLMAWNPLMNVFEIARYGWFESADGKYLDPWFLTAFCAAVVLCGMLALRRVREDIHVH
jgi:capsular polysaccharide transport system permease protein